MGARMETAWAVDGGPRGLARQRETGWWAAAGAPLGLALLGLALLATGCRPQAAPQPGPARVKATAVQARHFVPRFVRDFAPLYAAHLYRVTVSAAAADLLAQDGEGFANQAVLRRVYAGSPALRFVDEAGVNAAGRRLAERLAKAADHGLDPDHYHVARLEQLLAAVERAVVSTATAAAPAGAELEHVERVAKQLGIPLGDPRAQTALIEKLVIDGSPVPRLAQAFAQHRVEREQRAEVLARVELTLADGFVRYARTLSRGNTRPEQLRASWRWKDNQASGTATDKPLVLRDREAYVRDLLVADLRAVHDGARLDRILADLAPPHPQYRRLMAALRRYRRLAEQGGWPQLRLPRRLRPGRRHHAVKALKHRLAREGYFDGPMNTHYGPVLVAALMSYQQVHQLNPTGRLDAGLRRSLNVSAKQREQAIVLTLQRWRESAISHGSYHVFINVPDFHLEVWRGDERLARNRIVVGKRYGTKCDERTRRRVLEYATPLQSARIERLVFSPYWNVTADIKEQELDPERGKDPSYYERRGYEVLRDGAAERVREMPGPSNSLGFVKFIFPNRYNTYVHDTPKKQLFKHPRRAYSHGCMRTQHPRDLAKLLLTEDEQWNEQRFARLHRRWLSMNTRRLRRNFSRETYERLRRKGASLQTTVQLREPVPIHIEYYTVRVDDQHRVHFLGDVYGLDRKKRHPREAPRCAPESWLARRRFQKILERIGELEQRVSELDACLDGSTDLARSLAEAEGKRMSRLVRRLKRMERFAQDHANLVQHIREEHAKLTGELVVAGGAWERPLVRQAVRVQRLVRALEKLTRRGQRTCSAAQQAAASVGATTASDQQAVLGATGSQPPQG